jgi:hypothetical protein
MFTEGTPHILATPPETAERWDLKKYNALQTEIILSEKNAAAARAYLASQSGWQEHELSRNELAQYFIDSGQAKEFEDQYKWRLQIPRP